MLLKGIPCFIVTVWSTIELLDCVDSTCIMHEAKLTNSYVTQLQLDVLTRLKLNHLCSSKFAFQVLFFTNKQDWIMDSKFITKEQVLKFYCITNQNTIMIELNENEQSSFIGGVYFDTEQSKDYGAVLNEINFFSQSMKRGKSILTRANCTVMDIEVND
jgi:hypothetical protein